MGISNNDKYVLIINRGQRFLDEEYPFDIDFKILKVLFSFPIILSHPFQKSPFFKEYDCGRAFLKP